METRTQRSEGNQEGEGMTNGYAMNETVWFRGDEYKIISEPFPKFGLGKFQHARAIEGTKVVWVPTPESRKAGAERNQKEHKDMQDGFRRLKARQDAASPGFEVEVEPTKYWQEN